MFKAQPIPREVIDAWPLAGSGLSARVVNGCVAAGITTVKDLRNTPRADLLNLHAIGRLSMRNIRSFNERCDRIVSGAQIFIIIQEVFDLMLDREEMDVLSKRFGFRRIDMDASSNHMTLQEIGNEIHRTRERVRQVEEMAREKMGTRLAMACLSPFYLYVRTFIQSRGAVASLADCADLDGQSWLSDYNPCSIIQLLYELDPTQITRHNKAFSILTRDHVQEIERTACTILKEKGTPLPLTKLAQEMQRRVPQISETIPEAALGKLLDHAADAGATIDHRYFHMATGVESLIAEILKTFDTPTHYRTITDAFNNAVKPQHRKGSGFILKQLNTSDLFIKEERGQYKLLSGVTL